MKLPPLENLRIFEAVARLRGFTAAAESLALSHSAVSRRISELEKRLGVQLLQRSSRQVTLTPAGKVLFAAAQDALSRIQEATEEILRPTQQRPLLVSCERSLAMRWLIPRLSEFQDANPDIPVHLSTGGGAIDLMAQNIDLAIRRADFELDPRTISIALFKEYIGPVIAAQNPHSLPKVAKMTRLHTTGRPDAWHSWMQHARNSPDRQGHGASTIHSGKAPPQDQYFDHFFLSLQAAEAGLGTAIAPMFMVADSLACGKLLAPSGFIADGTMYIAILRTSLKQNSFEQRFIDWLQGAVAQTLTQTEKYQRQ